MLLDDTDPVAAGGSGCEVPTISKLGGASDSTEVESTCFSSSSSFPGRTSPLDEEELVGRSVSGRTRCSSCELSVMVAIDLICFTVENKGIFRSTFDLLTPKGKPIYFQV